MRKPTVLITGRSSFLARHFIRAASEKLEITTADRVDISAAENGTFDAAVNFACDPSYYTNPYDSVLDLDLALANRLRNRVGHYFFLSSRVVYGRTEAFAIPESQTTDPQSHYARNKVTTESALSDLIGPQLTILRLANIFGNERGRRTFAGQALTSLRANGEIILDIAPQTRRDFLPVEDFASALVKVIDARPGGILNIGSGSMTSVGDMAAWFVRGFGSGCVRVSSNQVRDAFGLDITALTKIVGDVTSPEAVERAAVKVGWVTKNA